MHLEHPFAFHSVLGAIFNNLLTAILIIGSMSNLEINSYFDRISTISRYRSNDADFNIKSRFFMWEQGIEIGLTHPLLGVGLGATAPYLALEFEGVQLRDKESKVEGFSMHNTFIQIFAECGVIGLVLFCLMLFFAYRNLTAVARFAKGQPEQKQLVILADVGRLYFVGYLVGGMFTSIDYDWTLFAFVALAISSRQYIQKTELKSSI
jgi:O-antigen ligase